MHDNALPPSAADAVASDTLPLLAPWWHTAAFLLLLATWAAISSTRTRTFTHTPHPITYISQVMMTWMLLSTVLAGIFHRKCFFFATLRHNARSLRTEIALGAAIYVGFYACVIAVVSVFALSTTAFRAIHPASTPPAQDITQPAFGPPPPRATTPLPPPAPVSPAPLHPLRSSRFQFNSKTVRALAPSSLTDLILWIGVSITAAFCEEHIFRGYLLTQARTLLRGAGASTLLTDAIAVVSTSLIFGGLHMYEGFGGACLIACLGALYAVCALKLGNLRAVIAAHFLQDILAGVFFYIAHARAAH